MFVGRLKYTKGKGCLAEIMGLFCFWSKLMKLPAQCNERQRLCDKYLLPEANTLLLSTKP